VYLMVGEAVRKRRDDTINLKCLLLTRDWRDNGEECSRCGRTRVGVHKPSKEDCGKCLKCGSVRQGRHSWDGLQCAVCGKKRPVRPPSFKPQPEAIAPTDQEIEDAFVIARLVGYLVVSNHLFPVVQAAVESVGEVIVWQLAGKQGLFLSAAREAAEEAMEKPSTYVRAYCDQHVPLLLKYRYFLDDDRTPWTTNTLDALYRSITK
jgi:hypothetical protein